MMCFTSDIFWIVHLYLNNNDFIFIIKIEIKKIDFIKNINCFICLLKQSFTFVKNILCIVIL